MSTTTPVDPKSWTFWKARIARALVVGALALGATQILPSLPRDQELEVTVPEGSISKLTLTYLESSDSSTALAGATLSVPAPGTKARHTARLQDGEYLLLLEAEGKNPAGKTVTWRERRPITLEGQLVSIPLRSNKPQPSP